MQNYIIIDGKKVYVRIIIRHNTSQTYVVRDDKNSKEYYIPFNSLKEDDGLVITSKSNLRIDEFDDEEYMYEIK